MKHILGTSTSNLDFKGAKGPKTELDYLRLVYAVKEIKKQGDDAQGYLVVMTDEMLNRVSQWEHKYRGKGHVKVKSASLPERIRRKFDSPPPPPLNPCPSAKHSKCQAGYIPAVSYYQLAEPEMFC